MLPEGSRLQGEQTPPGRGARGTRTVTKHCQAKEDSVAVWIGKSQSMARFGTMVLYLSYLRNLYINF